MRKGHDMMILQHTCLVKVDHVRTREHARYRVNTSYATVSMDTTAPNVNVSYLTSIFVKILMIQEIRRLTPR